MVIIRGICVINATKIKAGKINIPLFLFSFVLAPFYFYYVKLQIREHIEQNVQYVPFPKAALSQ